MTGPSTRNEIPTGVRDRLPREAARMRYLSARMQAVFASWGYEEILTPGFEYLETVTAGSGALSRREDLYQFFDRKGKTLALRADMTTPIARVAATKLTGVARPLRLSYFAPVFRRRDSRAGMAAEIWQAGIELIGASGPAADAEVVALACAALTAVGLDQYQIGIGHVDFVEGIFAEAGVTPEQEGELKAALLARDLVAFEGGVRSAGVPADKADLLLAMATFQGSLEQAVRRFEGVSNERVQRALAELGTTLAYLGEMGVASQVSLDLGLIRSLGYYTGILFEGYAPGVGSPVMGGGRYDRLLADFGGDEPGAGFALEMDRLLDLLDRQTLPVDQRGPDVLVACPKGHEAQAMTRARQLRGRGLTVEVDLLGREGEELTAYARERKARRILRADGESQPVTAGQNGSSQGAGPMASGRMAGGVSVSSIH